MCVINIMINSVPNTLKSICLVASVCVVYSSGDVKNPNRIPNRIHPTVNPKAILVNIRVCITRYANTVIVDIVKTASMNSIMRDVLLL